MSCAELSRVFVLHEPWSICFMTMLQDSEIAGKIFVAIEKLGDSKVRVES